jgi:Arc/MetJ-type ribon-helix-helix transcriptional regulator
MILGMTRKAKIAVTLPQELVDAAQTAVRDGRAASVSAYVAEALRQRETADELQKHLDRALARTGGPLTDAERAEIDRLAGW